MHSINSCVLQLLIVIDQVSRIQFSHCICVLMACLFVFMNICLSHKCCDCVFFTVLNSLIISVMHHFPPDIDNFCSMLRIYVLWSRLLITVTRTCVDYVRLLFHNTWYCATHECETLCMLQHVIDEGLGRGKKVHHDLPLSAFASLL